MGTFEIASILIALTAIFSFINFKYLHLPTTIGIMLLSLAASLAVSLLGGAVHPLHQAASNLVNSIDFHRTLFHGMLAFLLFAGALHLDLGDLAKQWGLISVLSLLGTAVSTFLVGFLCWIAFRRLGITLPFIQCLIFGALISPTDPIAVLGIMRKVGASRSLETQIAGESLFNDGIGVVIFLTVIGVASGENSPSFSSVSLLLIRQAAGGVIVGLAAGMVTYQLLKRAFNYQVEVLLTLALAMGGYALADLLHVSAPIEVVVAGLFFGNHGRVFGMSQKSRENLDMFWEIIDDVLNAMLFLLMGLQVLVLAFNGRFVLAGILSIFIVLGARFICVFGIITAMRSRRSFERGTVPILTWGGLRGGLSVAMALSLPQGPYHDLIIVATYAVVVFSVLVQGLTAGSVIKWAGETKPVVSPSLSRV